MGGVSVNNRTRVNSKLRSVTEELRYRASYDFAVMTATDSLGVRLPNPDLYDRDVVVRAWIDPIDSVTRTRRVRLLAKWKEGEHEKEKETIFSLGYVKAIAPAARAHFKVVRANNPSEGIQNVRIEVHGQNGPRVGFTASDGSLTIDDVYSDTVNGASMTVTGLPVCYFNDGGTNKYFLTGNSWRTGPTSPGQTDETHFVTPIEGYILSEYKFVAVDDASGGLIDGAKVRVREKNVSPGLAIIFPFHPYYKDETTGVMFNHGEAIVSGLPPGEYETVFMGSPEHPALELYNSETNSAHQNTLGTEETKIINVRVPKKGAMRGEVKSVSVSMVAVPQVSLGSNLPLPIKLRFYFDVYKVFDSLNSLARMDDTMTGNCFRNNQCAHLAMGTHNNQMFEILSSAGNFLINNLTPVFAKREGTLAGNPSNLSTSLNQNNLIAYRPSFESNTTNYFVPAPATPILVQHKDQTPDNNPAFPPANFEDLKMFLMTDLSNSYEGFYELSVPVRNSSGASTAISDWNVRIKLGGLAAGNTKDLYFLDRNSLSNLHGEIRQSDGLGGDHSWAPPGFSGVGDGHYVTTLWYHPDVPSLVNNLPDSTKRYERGFGFVELMGGDSDKAILRNYMKIDTNIDLATHPHKQTYSFSVPGGLALPLPPNIGEDKTVFKYSAREATEHTKSFYGTVNAKVKVKRIVDGADTYPIIDFPLDEVDINKLSIEYTRLESGDKTRHDVRITDHLFDPADSWPHNVRSYNTYEAWSTPIKLNPGQDTPLDVVVPNTPVLRWDRFNLDVVGDTDPSNNWLMNTRSGPLYEYALNAGGPGVDGYTGPAIEVILEAKTGLIQGHVVDNTSPTHPPISGVIVFLKRTVRNPDGTIGESSLNTTTDSNGYYSFNNVSFFPGGENKNIQLSYFHIDYNDVVDQWLDAYNYDEATHLPFSLDTVMPMTLKTSGGSGGSGGGDL